MNVYPDTSVLFSWYLPDQNASAADKLMRDRPSLLVTHFHRAELANALFQWVFRGKMTDVEARRALMQFLGDCQGGVFVTERVPELVYLRSVELAERHVAELGTRTLDTLHAAAALELGASVFWSFDERQLGLARAAGLATN